MARPHLELTFGKAPDARGYHQLGPRDMFVQQKPSKSPAEKSPSVNSAGETSAMESVEQAASW